MKRSEMSLISSRNHHLTFGVSCVVICVLMLLFLLHKTHEQLEVTRGELAKVNDKFVSVNKQFESLYEYKERLENSFVDLKEKKSTMSSQSESLKSELSVLKQSHRTEMQRLQDELDSCRRAAEMAVIHNQPQGDEALPPQIHPDSSNNKNAPGDKPSFGSAGKGGIQNHDIKVISSLSKTSVIRHSSSSNHHPGAGGEVNFIGRAPPVTNQPPQAAIQPSVDPNQDPVGNVFI